MHKPTEFSLKMALLTMLAASVIACGGGGGTSQTDGTNDYLTSLPKWSEFSPEEAESVDVPDGAPVSEADVTLTVSEVDGEGVPYDTEVTYSCQTQAYTATATPEKIVMFSPDRELLWPGALIQGKSHRDGRGSLLGLPIAERTAINVSIPDLSQEDNFRTVESPSLATVEQARGAMIGAATKDGLSTPSSISFKMVTTSTEEEAALKIGLSGKYLGFKAKAEGSVEINESKKTITAVFYQKMYEVVVSAPQTPGAFFSADFSAEKLQEQIDLGRIGTDNLPVYISNIVYGRMMMFSMTSTASEKEMQAILNASYKSIGTEGTVDLDARQKKILETSEIKIFSLGGDQAATIAMIKTGKWSDYFTDSAPLSSAAPLSYTFRNLGDGSIATVSETTSYNVKSCQTAGLFNFLDLQAMGLPISTPAKAYVADVNGDGIDDIIWNSLKASSNETVVALANGDGTFTMQKEHIFTHTAKPAGGWPALTMQTGDFNGDGRADLIWSGSRGFVALANPAESEGSHSFTGFTEIAGNFGVVGEYKTGDFTGDGKDDLIAHRLFTGSDGAIYKSINYRISNGDGTFTALKSQLFFSSADWVWNAWDGTEGFAVVDANSDGRADLMWYTQGKPRDTVWTALSVSKPGAIDHFNSFGSLGFNRNVGDWRSYDKVVGNIDGNGGEDLILVDSAGADNLVARDIREGTGRCCIRNPEVATVYSGEGPFKLHMLDTNGDGRDDLLMNTMTATTNRAFLGYGLEDGQISYADKGLVQDHPARENWSLFTILTGDFNGDNRKDILYNNADATNSVYVGLSKP